jgi:hypothetical protein
MLAKSAVVYWNFTTDVLIVMISLILQNYDVHYVQHLHGSVFVCLFTQPVEVKVPVGVSTVAAESSLTTGFSPHAFLQQKN